MARIVQFKISSKSPSSAALSSAAVSSAALSSAALRKGTFKNIIMAVEKFCFNHKEHKEGTKER